MLSTLQFLLTSEISKLFYSRFQFKHKNSTTKVFAYCGSGFPYNKCPVIAFTIQSYVFDEIARRATTEEFILLGITTSTSNTLPAYVNLSRDITITNFIRGMSELERLTYLSHMVDTVEWFNSLDNDHDIVVNTGLYAWQNQ